MFLLHQSQNLHFKNVLTSVSRIGQVRLNLITYIHYQLNGSIKLILFPKLVIMLVVKIKFTNAMNFLG